MCLVLEPGGVGGERRRMDVDPPECFKIELLSLYFFIDIVVGDIILPKSLGLIIRDLIVRYLLVSF